MSTQHHPHPCRRAIAAAAASVLAITALAGCSTPAASSPDAPPPGVTDDTVTIGSHQPLTGPAAAGYASISAATKAYFDYVNDNGGINGRTIEYIVKDDGYNPATTTTVVRELVQEDEVFAIVNGLGTPTHTAVLDFLNQNKVPDLFVASGSTSWNQPEKYPYTFAFNADYVTEGAALAQYATDEFAGKKVCLLGQDDDFGEEFIEGAEAVLGADGLVAVERYSVSNQDVTAQIGALKAAGCEINLLATVNGFTALAVGTAAAMGWFPQWFSSSSGADYPTLATFIGDAAPQVLQGFTSTNYLPSALDADNEWVAQFEQINDQYNDGATFDGNTVFGMSVGYLFAEALAKAGDDPTRDSLIAAITSGEVQGNGIAPVAFGDDDHGAYYTVGITTVDAGVQAFTGEVYARDGDTVTAVESEPVAFTGEGIPAP